jgi:glycosyltransferase involved in cell wall biosynthesis
VVSTRVGMVPDFLPEALLAPPGDEEALTALLAWTRTHAPEWQALMQPVFARARAELTLEAMVAKTVAVYENALEPTR